VDPKSLLHFGSHSDHMSLDEGLRSPSAIVSSGNDIC